MNLGDLVTQICTGIDMPESEDQDACKLFLKQQAKLLWGRALWKDSVAQFTSTISSTGAGMTTALWLPSRGTFVCPSMVDRVLACRLDSRYLNIEDQGVYFRFDAEVFDTQGQATQFHLLSPCVWEFDTATNFRLHGDAADATATGKVSYLDTDNFSVVTSTATFGAQAGSPVASTIRIDAITKGATDGAIDLIDDDALNILLTMAKADTAAPTRQRIRIVRIPTASTTIRVLAKVVMPSFSADADNPPIRGSEDVLIALTQSAMYQRDHQVGKAEQLLQQAAGHYDNLFKLETVQQAHNRRIVPDDGFGECSVHGGAWWASKA